MDGDVEDVGFWNEARGRLGIYFESPKEAVAPLPSSPRSVFGELPVVPPGVCIPQHPQAVIPHVKVRHPEIRINKYTTMADDTEARVEDFLNDKFQTLADLETLDSLLSSVQSQQSLLRSQVPAPHAPHLTNEIG